jgi:ribose/xylose/arabinose/galactoside ABC-type transport system permease subunit
MANLNVKTGEEKWYKKAIGIFTRSKTPIASLIILYIAMVVIFASFSPYYLTIGNFRSIFNNFAVLGILSAGITIVMIGGGFDLSIGSTMGLIGIICAVLMLKFSFIPVGIVMVIAVIIGCFLGLINGLIIAKIGINPIITTLGTLAVFRGIAFFWADLNVRIYSDFWDSVGRSFIGGIIPYTTVYIIVIFIILALVLKFTKFGRNLYTIGGNEYLAKLAGIKVERIKIASYVISGLFCGLAAIVLTSQLGSGRPEYGAGKELEVLTIVVLGGVTVGGGKGNYLGTFIALIIIGSIANGLVLLDVPVFLRMVIKGGLLVLAISIDALRNRRRLQLY